MRHSILKSFIQTLILGLVSSVFVGCSCDSTGPKTNFPIDVGQRPESITKGWGGLYYVTVMNGQEIGDGVIKVIQGDDVSVFATGLNEPKGIAFVGDFLVASDIDRVVKIDSKGIVSVLAGPNAFPHAPSYLNDVASDANGTGVYVTDMGANTKMRGPDGLWPLDSAEAAAMPIIGRVYHVKMDGSVSLTIDSNPLMTNPNGVGVGNDGQLLVGAFFKGNFLIHKNGKLSVLVADQLRGVDAVEQDSHGNYYASSWSQAKVWKISEDGSSVQILKDGFQSAADFYLDETNNRLLLPDMLAGKIYEISLGN
ncbi:MAG: gluconolaconase [Verrucomicrobia bacterium]|nr:gluconolaconase [Verrucomicrobiota bacterium]MDA1065747.1 gluconolaconase [Verrucomicrobiota bacterium]